MHNSAGLFHAESQLAGTRKNNLRMENATIKRVKAKQQERGREQVLVSIRVFVSAEMRTRLS